MGLAVNCASNTIVRMSTDADRSILNTPEKEKIIKAEKKDKKRKREDRSDDEAEVSEFECQPSKNLRHN